MTATLVGFLAVFVAGLLLIAVAAMLDADDIRTVPVYVPRPASSPHLCWAEYDPAVLSSNRAVVAAEMAAVRAEYPPVVHIGRELVAV